MVCFTLRSLCPWSKSTQYTSSGRDNRCDMGDVCEPTADLTPVVNTAATLMAELRARVKRILPVHAQDWSIPGKDAQILPFGIHRDLFKSSVFPRQQSVTVWTAVSPPALPFAFDELHLSPNSSQPALRNEKQTEIKHFWNKKLWLTYLLVVQHTWLAVRGGRTRQTDWYSHLPTCRIALHPVCHHPSPLLNSVSTTPGFKPSRHAPVAWSKGGATDGTRPDLHLPPPSPTSTTYTNSFTRR